MTFWIFLAALGAAWVLQSYLSFKQTQSFTKLFVAMRRRGRVAMGRFKGGIVQGAIVLFGIDADGGARRLQHGLDVGPQTSGLGGVEQARHRRWAHLLGLRRLTHEDRAPWIA